MRAVTVFGTEEYFSNRAAMEAAEYSKARMPIWFGGGKELDAKVLLLLTGFHPRPPESLSRFPFLTDASALVNGGCAQCALPLLCLAKLRPVYKMQSSIFLNYCLHVLPLNPQ
jgi:hypothetical protein